MNSKKTMGNLEFVKKSKGIRKIINILSHILNICYGIALNIVTYEVSYSWELCVVISFLYLRILFNEHLIIKKKQWINILQKTIKK